MDRLGAIAAAATLCPQYAVEAIVVPAVRVELTKKAHGELRLDLLDCSGHVIGRALGEADVGGGLTISFASAGSYLVTVTEKAAGPALDQLFPLTVKGAPNPTPS